VFPLSLDVVVEVVDRECANSYHGADLLSFVTIEVFHQFVSDGREIYWLNAHQDRSLLPTNWVWTQ